MQPQPSSTSDSFHHSIQAATFSMTYTEVDHNFELGSERAKSRPSLRVWLCGWTFGVGFAVEQMFHFSETGVLTLQMGLIALYLCKSSLII